MPIRKRKTVRSKRSKKPSELEKRKAEISKLRGQMRTRTKELKSQIVEKEALLLEKDKELASLSEVMEEKVKELESSLVEKGEEILTLRQAEERNRELETKVRQLETELGRKALVVEENLIGRVTHYYSHLSVGIVELTGGELKVGDAVHIKGTHTDFTQTVDSMQIEHENVSHAEKSKVVGIKVKERVREHDQVFRT
jgi:putative protease